MQDFRNLRVYEQSKSFVVKLYEVLKDFPQNERFGLCDQLRRASVSIPSNIAEGCGMSSQKGFVKFLYHSLGSAKEVECQLDISRSLKFLTDKQFNELNDEIISISKQLCVLIKRIEESEKK
jgi:four helix bundle protein